MSLIFTLSLIKSKTNEYIHHTDIKGSFFTLLMFQLITLEYILKCSEYQKNKAVRTKTTRADGVGADGCVVFGGDGLGWVGGPS